MDRYVILCLLSAVAAVIDAKVIFQPCHFGSLKDKNGKVISCRRNGANGKANCPENSYCFYIRRTGVCCKQYWLSTESHSMCLCHTYKNRSPTRGSTSSCDFGEPSGDVCGTKKGLRCPIGYACSRNKRIVNSRGICCPKKGVNSCDFGEPSGDICGTKQGLQCPIGFACTRNARDVNSRGICCPKKDTKKCKNGTPAGDICGTKRRLACPRGFSCFTNSLIRNDWGVCCPDNSFEPLRCKPGEATPDAVCGTARHIPCPLHYYCKTRHVWSEEAGICCPSDRVRYRMYVEPTTIASGSSYSEPDKTAEKTSHKLGVVLTDEKSASMGQNNWSDRKIKTSVSIVILDEKTTHRDTKVQADGSPASRGESTFVESNIPNSERHEATSTQATTVQTTHKENEITLAQPKVGVENSNSMSLKLSIKETTTIASTKTLSTALTTESNQEVEMEEAVTVANIKAEQSVITTSIPKAGAENAEYEANETNTEGFGGENAGNGSFAGGNETQYYSVGETEVENELVNKTNILEHTTAAPAATTVEQEAEEINVALEEPVSATPVSGHRGQTEEPAEFEAEYEYNPYPYQGWYYY